MAEKLTLDDGVIELEINENGLLRFNPSDPNVYQRFMAMARELPELEKGYSAQFENGAQDSEQVAAEEFLNRMKAFDTDMKGRLSGVFGTENDFDALLGGVNLMAVGRNGQRIISNLLKALTPYVEKGVKQYRESAAEEAVAAAKRNRAGRKGK